MMAGISGARILAAALSLAATGALMILAKAAHPPAGATAFISLGIVTKPLYFAVIEVAVAPLTLQGNRDQPPGGDSVSVVVEKGYSISPAAFEPGGRLLVLSL
jgi:hypothetical protein